MGKRSLVEIMNESFTKLGSSRKIEKIEEIPALAIETRVLQEKRIMIIDDVRSVLVFFAPYFIAATGGEVSFIYFEKESLEELVGKILKENPEIVLLDYNLSAKIKGNVVCQKLKTRDFKGLVFGFSSINTKDEFLKAGATGFVPKNTVDPDYTIELLAKYVKESDDTKQ